MKYRPTTGSSRKSSKVCLSGLCIVYTSYSTQTDSEIRYDPVHRSHPQSPFATGPNSRYRFVDDHDRRPGSDAHIYMIQDVWIWSIRRLQKYISHFQSSPCTRWYAPVYLPIVSKRPHAGPSLCHRRWREGLLPCLFWFFLFLESSLSLTLCPIQLERKGKMQYPEQNVCNWRNDIRDWGKPIRVVVNPICSTFR